MNLSPFIERQFAFSHFAESLAHTHKQSLKARFCTSNSVKNRISLDHLFKSVRTSIHPVPKRDSNKGSKIKSTGLSFVKGFETHYFNHA